MRKKILIVVILGLILAYSCSIDKQESKIVEKDPFEWSAENLNVSTFRNGDPIPQAKTNEEWKKAGNEGTPAWCYYNNDPENGKKYGKLYNWYAVNDPRGLCPEGWHIPSHDEWNSLIGLLGDNPGNQLKSPSGWENDGNGINSIGFTALPAGIRYVSGCFDDLGRYAHFWTSKEKEPRMLQGTMTSIGAWHHFMSYRDPLVRNIHSYGLLKGTGMSLRCVRRKTYDGYDVVPSDPPNHGILFVDHEATGRSGHIGLALTECVNGDILAFYMDASGIIMGGHDNTGWTEYKRSTDGGKTWGDPVIFEYSKRIWDENGEVKEELETVGYKSAYVASIITAPNGNLVAMINGGGKDVQYVLSYDNGHTWTEPKLVDKSAPRGMLGKSYSDGGLFVNDGTIYSIYIGTGPKGKDYFFYASTDNGETFHKRSEYLFESKTYNMSYCYMTGQVLDNGKIIVYTYNIDDEFNLPYVISEDNGYTWSEVKSTYMEKKIRNPQLSAKIGEYYFMNGRSGHWGEDAKGLVLYASKDGINWDKGVFLNQVIQAVDSYSANEVIGKYDPSTPNRLLIQSSISYSGYRVNVKHWWVENILGTK